MDGFMVRKVAADDAQSIAQLLQEIAAAGKRTRPSDVGFVTEHYISHPDQVQCTVAAEGSQVFGFQSLKLAVAGNPYGVPVGWGIIGTHIRPSAARKGIGRALFGVTRSAARAASLSFIDATIGAQNAEGLAYYSAMGFVDYRSHHGAVCKRYAV